MTFDVIVPINHLLSFSINWIKSKLYNYYEKKKVSCMFVPSDEIKTKIISFLVANEFIVFDIDHIEKYIDWSNVVQSHYIENRVELKKLIKKFKQYIIKDYKNEGKIIYVSKNLDIVNVFNASYINVFIPSPVYLSINNVEKNEMYDVKTRNLPVNKKILPNKRKYYFNSDEEILNHILSLLKH